VEVTRRERCSTNVVSDLRKVKSGRADAGVASWARRVPASALFVSALTIQELEIGTLLTERRDPTQGAILRAWLEDHVLPAFADRVLPVDTGAAQRSKCRTRARSGTR
jgi:predicted nucleic acid-binding protein